MVTAHFYINRIAHITYEEIPVHTVPGFLNFTIGFLYLVDIFSLRQR